ncbi:MAG TPA: hypothetical protein DIS89_04505, partial [Weissella cibaria]|nr:hypothetical protein [Weissella cibaria]
MAATEKFGTSANTIVMNYKANLQKVTVNFVVNKYQANHPTVLQETGAMPVSDQTTITLTGKTGEKLTLSDSDLAKYLSSKTLPSNILYSLDDQANNPKATDVIAFDDDDTTNQSLTLYYTGTSINYTFVMVTTDTVGDAFDNAGHFIGIPTSEGYKLSGTSFGVSVLPVGMGTTVDGQFLFKGYGNFNQGGQKFVLTTAGSANPWSEQMTLSGVVDQSKTVVTSNGAIVVTVGTSAAPAKLTYSDGTSQTFGSVNGISTNRTSFTYTLTPEQKIAYQAAVAAGQSYMVSTTDVGWEFYRKGYIDGIKLQQGLSYSPNIASAGDESVWALAYTTVPTTVSSGDMLKTVTDITKQNPVYAFVYYPKTAQQTVQVNYVDENGKAILNADGTPKVAYVQGTANTAIDYTGLTKSLNGYQLLSDG